MHVVADLAFDGVIPFDLAMPCELFSRVEVPGVAEPYRVCVCGAGGIIRAGLFNLQPLHGLEAVARANTVVLPGIADPALPVPGELLAAVKQAAESGARVASICSGAFVLAATGLLDGLRATTHWRAAALLATQYPSIQVDPGVLDVDNGQILTSAGAAAGLDLCLHMVRRDYGPSIAAHAALLAVMPLERDGGQTQFIVHAPPQSPASLEPLLQWLMANLHRPLTLEDAAARARLTPRTFNGLQHLPQVQADGTWDAIWRGLYVMLREREGREASPSAAIIDSQTIKSAAKGGARRRAPLPTRPTQWVTTPADK